MFKRSLTLAVLVFLGLSVSSSFAQEESRFGLGVDVQNQSFELVSFAATGSPFFTLSHTSLTPAFLFSFHPNPNLFVEPSIGFRSSTDEITDTGVSPNLTFKETTRDIKFGLGLLYTTRPDEFVSPFVHAAVDFHLLSFKEEDDVDVFEATATAIVVAGGFGGIITINGSVFITLEGRLTYARVGDVEEKLSGPFASGFVDDSDTKASVFSTDMTIGLRVLFL